MPVFQAICLTEKIFGLSSPPYAKCHLGFTLTVQAKIYLNCVLRFPAYPNPMGNLRLRLN